MNKQNEEFLNSFRELDSELTVTVPDYEVTLPEGERNRMTMCRHMRNFITHIDPDFIQASEEQIRFLKSHIEKVKQAKGTIKTLYRTFSRLCACYEGEKLSDAIERIRNDNCTRDVLPFISKKGRMSGFISYKKLFEVYATRGIRTKLKEDDAVKVTVEEVPMNFPSSDLDGKNVYAVVNKQGKQVGLWWKGMIL